MRILISYPTQIENEAHLINELIASGDWDLFHLRKPTWKSDEVTRLLNDLSDEVKSKTVLHQNFKGSCHSFEEVEALNQLVILNEVKNLKYCFLSPIYDSISKKGYKENFEKEELKTFLQKKREIKVIGLGGVTEENYQELIAMGFDGGAFLGSVWSKYNLQCVINNE